MQLDYNPANGAFVLNVARYEADPNEIMRVHGFDFSVPASTYDKAVLFTHEPYAAVAFWNCATPAARDQLVRLKGLIDSSWAKDSAAHLKVPYDEELWPFQKAGVEYALRRRNTLIGDVPGLGKTAQAIVFANEISAKRVLVICPANIRLQWAKSIRRWSTMAWPFVVYPIINGKRGVHPNAAWTVVSYDLARTEAIHRALLRGTYDLLVLDEGHYLKTVDARRTRAVFGVGGEHPVEALASKCGSILALTGTPLPNRPREAYTLVRGLCFDAIDFMSEDRFKERFNPSMTRTTAEGKMFVDERSGRQFELQARLRSNLMVRREKHGENGVMGQLKLPVYDIVLVEETGAVKQALAAEKMLDLDPEQLAGADMTTLGAIATVRRMMGVAMAPLVADYVEMCIDGGEDKLVVYAHHQQVLDILEHRLSRYGLVRVDGSTSVGQREAKKNRFIKDPSVRIFLANMLAAGTGTDGLQEVCSHCIVGEPDWTPGNNQQGVDRLDRGGQKGQVQADFLVAPGSFSEKVLASALRKNKDTHLALDAAV